MSNPIPWDLSPSSETRGNSIFKAIDTHPIYLKSCHAFEYSSVQLGERRAKIKEASRGFNHEDPKEWPSAYSYRELQQAPDYHKERNLFIVAPDGTYAACCIVWFNEDDRVGHLDPLSTHPKYRKMGLGMQRLKALGATYMPMDDGFDPFYLAIGFEVHQTRRPWIKTF